MTETNHIAAKQREEPQSVSIVIPTHNGAATIGICIESLLHNTRKPDEIIVIDDGSTDATSNIVESYAERTDITIRVLRNDIALGPAAGRNQGADAATSETLIFVDSDTKARPDMIAKALRRLASADAVCGVYDPEPLNLGAAARYKALFDSYQFSRNSVIEYDGFSGYCAAIWKDVYQDVGGFNADLGARDEYENEEFGYRLSKSYRVVIDPDLRVQHHFPTFSRLTRNYFVRVSQWVRLARQRKQFEQAGDATSSGAFGAVIGAVVLTSIASWLVLCTSPWLIVASVAVWYPLHQGFLRHVRFNAPSFIWKALVLNWWFSTVIVFGAAYGLLTSVGSSGTQADTP